MSMLILNFLSLSTGDSDSNEDLKFPVKVFQLVILLLHWWILFSLPHVADFGLSLKPAWPFCFQFSVNYFVKLYPANALLQKATNFHWIHALGGSNLIKERAVAPQLFNIQLKSAAQSFFRDCAQLYFCGMFISQSLLMTVKGFWISLQ